MKIGFDAKRAVKNDTGLGNYSRYVIENLANFYPENNYLLFSPSRKENPRLAALKSMKHVHFVFPSGIWKFLSSCWKVSSIKSDLTDQSIDIFHGLCNELPLGIRKTGIKSVVTIHDLIFIRYPEDYKLADRLIHQWKLWKFKYACRHADKVIAVSECTKRDIISFFKIPATKIEVVYQGCHADFSKPVPPEKKEEITKKYNLPGKLILYVGSIVIRKNLMLAVRSLLEIDSDVCLVAIGKKTSYQKKIERYIKANGLSDRVFILNHIPFNELPAFYQLASVFVYPSFFEGFGIPVIEALSSNVPVVAATGSCLEEAGGKDSLYIDPNDHTSLAEKINNILNDPELSAFMAKKGKQYVTRFSADKTAKALLDVYEQLQ